MVRSFAWALSAPAFRAIQAALFLLGLPDGTNYVVSLWLSIAASVCLAESFLVRTWQRPPRLATSQLSQAGVFP
jgi:hypothetical protein